MTKVRSKAVPDHLRRYFKYESHGYGYISPKGVALWERWCEARKNMDKAIKAYGRREITDEQFEQAYRALLKASSRKT